MSKFYSLLALLILALFCLKINAQTTDSCRANFERVPSTNATSLTANFHAVPWHNHEKKPVQVCWNFGDNHDTCIQYDPAPGNDYPVNHTYAKTGVYSVCVKILYEGGCQSDTCKSIGIGERDSCNANFEILASTANALGEYFVAQPWHNNNKKPVYICWNFGDNHDTCIQYSASNSNNYSVYHLYSRADNYNVCVKIQYDGGCESEKCKTIQIGKPDSCYADFEKIPAPTANNSSLVYYRALPKNNHDRRPSQVCWYFGDGADTCISYAENYSGSYITSHQYDHPGLYEVCVSINYYGGCEAKKCRNVEIFLNTDTCRVHLYEAAPSITSLTRQFYFISANTNRPVRVCWNFGDGTDTCISVEPNTTDIPYNIKHTYPSPGIYRTCVKVLFQNGCNGDNCIEVYVQSLADLCGGYYTDSLLDSHTYLFRAISIHKANDAVVSYQWTFGDGSSGVGEKIYHVYQKPSVYRVCLLINTDKGCETHICNDVRIAGTTPSRLQLSPNPVANVLHVLFYSARNETLAIKITNSNGIVIRDYNRTAVAGLNTWDFETTGLLPGVYSLSVYSSDQFASAIFLKE